MSFFRLLRITVLLSVLVIVAGNQWLTHARISSWEKPIWMTIYPVLSDDAAALLPYIESLHAGSFGDIGAFLERQGGAYGMALQTPLKLQIAPPLYQSPPAVPPGGKRLATAIWSLKMRWWAWRRGREDNLPGADIQMFVIYHKTDGTPLPERSVGVQKGMYGIVNAYASRAMASRNRVVIAHELLHVLGATDKYQMATGQPIMPEGLADPNLKPLYPQQKAEIMGGRIALSRTRAVMPASLRSCVVGQETAHEIGWFQSF